MVQKGPRFNSTRPDTFREFPQVRRQNETMPDGYHRISRSQVRVLPRAQRRRSEAISATMARATKCRRSINGPHSHGRRERAAPTFTPNRVFFLLLIGPVAALLMALLIQAGANSWVFGATVDQPGGGGAPTVAYGHFHAGGGR